MSKKKLGKDGIVFSTDPNFRSGDEGQREMENLPSSDQKLKVRLETKQRAGKAVTLIEGYIGSQNDLEELGKKLKTFCGTGGSVKNGQIIIQGDQRTRITQWLQNSGYPGVKKI
jgi:translation initiation factor 1